MFCMHCSKELHGNYRFCPNCGQPIPFVQLSAEATPPPQPTPQPSLEQIAAEREKASKKSGLATSAMVWGILSLAMTVGLSEPLLGFIFSFIAKAQARKYRDQFGQLEGSARLGHDLGTAGFFVGLFSLIVTVLVLILYVVIYVLGYMYIFEESIGSFYF